MSTTPILEVEGLHAHYGKSHVLQLSLIHI